MHRKNIRQLVTKQLKYNHPHRKKMTRKSKKELAKQVMDEVVSNYDYSQILVQRRNPGPQDQVRVQRLCPLYGSMLLYDQVVSTTED